MVARNRNCNKGEQTLAGKRAQTSTSRIDVMENTCLPAELVFLFMSRTRRDLINVFFTVELCKLLFAVH